MEAAPRLATMNGDSANKGMSVRNLASGSCALILLSVTCLAAAPSSDTVTVNGILMPRSITARLSTLQRIWLIKSGAG
jgi:hypothetical protein